MPNRPSENTLTVNITHRQLRSLNPPFSQLVAIAPTRVEEGAHRDTEENPEGGFDISLETAKEVVFQHKRPFDVTEHHGINWLKFDVDIEQCWALAEQYEIGQAFLALPIVWSEFELQWCLDLTVFVDVHLIDHYNDPNWMPRDGNSISTLYVEQSDELVERVRNGADRSNIDDSLAPSVYLKSNSNQWKMGGPAYREISMEDFKSPACDCAIAWGPLAEYIKSCRYGVRIRGGQSHGQTVPITDPLQRFLPTEMSNIVTPAYRNRIARARALAACSRGEEDTEVDRAVLTAAISEDIVNRREAMDDFFRLEVDSKAVSDRVHRAIDRFWGNESRFERVARRTRRNIIEGGESSKEIIIE